MEKVMDELYIGYDPIDEEIAVYVKGEAILQSLDHVSEEKDAVVVVYHLSHDSYIVGVFTAVLN